MTYDQDVHDDRSKVVGNHADLFTGRFGLVATFGNFFRSRRLSKLTDRLCDYKLRNSRALSEIRRRSLLLAPRNILVTGVDSNQGTMNSVLEQLRSKRHAVEYRIGTVAGKGKLENINHLLRTSCLEDFEWLIITDDDISLPAGFLDDFLSINEVLGFKLSMPAHRFDSYAGYIVTQRGWNTVARATNYVEIGPITAFHRDTFKRLFPLPELRWGWGVDFHWSSLAKKLGWQIGVIDATPIRHLRPIGSSYDRGEAAREAIDFLTGQDVLSREEMLKSTFGFKL